MHQPDPRPEATGQAPDGDGVRIRLAEWAERDAVIGQRREIESLRVRNEDLQACVASLQDRLDSTEAQLDAVRRDLRSTAGGRLWYAVSSALRGVREAVRRRG